MKNNLVVPKELAYIVPLVASSIVSYFFPMNKNYYESLRQSSLTPKPIVFSIVWPVLYLLIGYSLVNYPSKWLILNLVLNLSWIIVFNGYKNPKWAFYILVSMIVTLIFYLQETGNMLLVPYLLWLMFASYLNYFIAF